MPIKIKLIMTWWHRPLISSQWGRGQRGLQNETLFQYKTWFIKLKDINTCRHTVAVVVQHSILIALVFPSRRDDRQNHFPQIPQKSHFQKKTFLQSVPYFYNIQKKISFHLIWDNTQLIFLMVNFFIRLEGVPNSSRLYSNSLY